MKLKHLLAFLFTALIFFNFSCTEYKNVPYFQDLRRDTVKIEDVKNFSQLTIQPGDLIALHVTSLNADASAMFNYNLERPTGGSNLDRSEENAVIGFLVDKDGNIHLPIIGDVKVSGLTTIEISRLLESKLTDILKEPKVAVRMQNFRISVLGEVRNPNTFPVYNEQITIPQALSLAGDLTVTGIRKIILIREIEGKRTYVPIDLTNANALFNSPYYYLKSNDIIYVQPNRARVQNDGTTFQKASLVVSVLSVIVLLATRK